MKKHNMISQKTFWLTCLLLMSISLALADDEKVEEETDTNEVYNTLKENPEFPGGMDALHDYLRENVNYPDEARNDTIQGRVIVSFIVEPDGSLSDIEVREGRGVDPLLDNEAIRVVENMPDWEPGKLEGEAVRVRLNLPIRFRLTR